MSNEGPIHGAVNPPVRKPFWRDLTIGGMMAIVAALSLLFAAIAYQVQMQRRVRDATFRSACANNLKQIGLALASYAEEHGSYPFGSLPNPDLPVDRRLGWMYLLIPRLDLRGFSDADLPDRSWDDPAFSSHASPAPGPVSCPSQGRSATPTFPTPATYIGIAGLGVDAPGLPKGHARAGCFGDHRATSPGDVKDGLAQTMMVAESSSPAGPWFAGGRNTVRGLDPAQQPYIGKGRQFGDTHAGGVNVLMADGSVRFIKETADPKVFEAMSTIAGGEKVMAP
jgi:prepilin-type processing-associated H-X9-DG protein